MSSSFVANLNLNTQDVEEGQLPNYGISHPQHFHLPPPSLYNTPDRMPPMQPALAPHPSQPLPPPELVYETVRHLHHSKDPRYSPESKKKSHKSSHKSSRRHHHDSQREKDREREKARHQRREREKDLYGNDKNDKSGYQKEENSQLEAQGRPNCYPAAPYYPPYMYPPVPMMPHHMPPPHMYPYSLPPPSYMHPSSYPYPPSMLPPMPMAPPSLGYPNSKNSQPYTLPAPAFQKANESFKGPGNERIGRDQGLGEKGGENGYKMFGAGGGYMYPYGPPGLGYPPYPPPPYMMYLPPENYPESAEAAQREEHARLLRKKQYIDNQKQRIRKSLKHLPSELKIQMFETIRNVLKFDNPASESDGTASTPSDSDSLKTQLQNRILERSLLKIDRWLSQDEDRIRQAAAQLLLSFELNNVKNKIAELKAAKAAQFQSSWSESRRILSTLIRCPQQLIL